MPDRTVDRYTHIVKAIWTTVRTGQAFACTCRVAELPIFGTEVRIDTGAIAIDLVLVTADPICTESGFAAGSATESVVPRPLLRTFVC